MRTRIPDRVSSRRRPIRLLAVPEVVWAPVTAGMLMLLIGALGVVTGQAWLFPSLGPTAFMQAEYPEHPSVRFYHTFMGHLIGIIAGIAAVNLTGAGRAPAGHLTTVRVAAAVAAVMLSIFFGIVLRASHPPASATTLLFALGGFRPTFHAALSVLAGVVLISLGGELVRRLRLSHAVYVSRYRH